MLWVTPFFIIVSLPVTGLNLTTVPVTPVAAGAAPNPIQINFKIIIQNCTWQKFQIDWLICFLLKFLPLDIPVVELNKFVLGAALVEPKGVTCWFCCCGCPNSPPLDVEPKLNPGFWACCPNAGVFVVAPNKLVFAFWLDPKRLVFVEVFPNPRK